LALLLFDRDLDLDLDLELDLDLDLELDLDLDLVYVFTEAPEAWSEFENFSINAFTLLSLDFELDFFEPDLLVLFDFDRFYTSLCGSKGPIRKQSGSILCVKFLFLSAT